MVTSGGQAELGRALGGYVNVVTKSGTQRAHGDCYGYFRDDRFNAPNALSGHDAADEPEAVRRQPRRPVVRDRTFYFANVEQRRLDQSGLVDDHAGERRRDQRAAGGGRLSGPPVATGVYPNPVDSTNVLGKIDHQFERPRSVQRPLQPLRRHARATRAAPAA